MKNKAVIFGILLFLVVITIGYALLSGNINVSSTANINPTDINLTYDYGIIPYGDDTFNTNTSQSGHSNESITCSGSNCTYSVAFNLTESIQVFYIEVTNNSSFAVRLNQVTINSKYEGTTPNHAMGIIGIYNSTKEALNKNNIDSNRLVVKTISHASSDTDNIVISANEICDPSKGTYCILEPGHSYTIGIAEGTFNLGNENHMDFSVSRTINFEFQQYNSY